MTTPTPGHAQIPIKHGQVLFSAAHYKGLYGGRGGGKSRNTAIYIILRMTEAQSRLRIVCARQFQVSIRDSSKELLDSVIRALGLEGEFRILDRYIIHVPSGSEILFLGLERNPDSIKSLEGADLVWVDEAQLVNARSMEILRPTIRKLGSQLIFTWTHRKEPIRSTSFSAAGIRRRTWRWPV
jgi:phage terminase large subunit